MISWHLCQACAWRYVLKIYFEPDVIPSISKIQVQIKNWVQIFDARSIVLLILATSADSVFSFTPSLWMRTPHSLENKSDSMFSSSDINITRWEHLGTDLDTFSRVSDWLTLKGAWQMDGRTALFSIWGTPPSCTLGQLSNLWRTILKAVYDYYTLRGSVKLRSSFFIFQTRY